MQIFFMTVTRSLFAISFFFMIFLGLAHPHRSAPYYIAAAVAAFFYLLVGNPRKGS